MAAAVAACAAPAVGQAPPDPDFVRQPLFGTYDEFRLALDAAAYLPDATQRNAAIDDLWGRLRAAGQTPFALGDRAAFLYRGPATNVGWRGDFNGWGVSPGVRVGLSDVWIHERRFAPDARTDYKVFLNNRDWVLDPANPLEAWSGFGPNSELRMPEYAYPMETIRRPGVARGTLSAATVASSDLLSHGVRYRVYTPAGYEADALADLPTVYVTDGHEYAADHLGSLPAVLDNLIDDGTLAPAIAVFVDPRRPDNGQNARMNLYVDNADFIGFVADELVPTIDAAYRTDARAEGRTILGTSLGGYFAASLGSARPDVVRNVAMQSPWLRGAMIDAWAGGDLKSQNVVMTGGTLGDDRYSDAMDAALRAAGYDHTYLKVNDGHAWGAWRGQLDTILQQTVGPPTVVPEPAAAAALGAAGLTLVGKRRR